MVLNPHLTEANVDAQGGSLACSKLNSWCVSLEVGFYSRLSDSIANDNWVHGCLECLKLSVGRGKEGIWMHSGQCHLFHSLIQAEAPKFQYCPAGHPSGLCQCFSVRRSLQRQNKTGNLAQGKALEKQTLFHHDYNKAVRWVEIILFWLYAWGLYIGNLKSRLSFLGFLPPLVTHL